MATPRRAAQFSVRINSLTWGQEVERYLAGAAPRRAAERERRGLERDGVHISVLLGRGRGRHEPPGTRKGLRADQRCAAVATAARRFIPTKEGALALVAFGERHLAAGTRSVYERAHKRLHGRYPDQ